MKRNKFVRIMCIFLAILMLGSVVIGAISAFALEPQTMAIPAATKSNGSVIVGIIAGVALIGLVSSLVAPKIMAKKNG